MLTTNKLDLSSRLHKTFPYIAFILEQDGSWQQPQLLNIKFNQEILYLTMIL